MTWPAETLRTSRRVDLAGRWSVGKSALWVMYQQRLYWEITETRSHDVDFLLALPRIAIGKFQGTL